MLVLMLFEEKTSPRIGVTDEFYRMELEFINTSKEYEENKLQTFKNSKRLYII